MNEAVKIEYVCPICGEVYAYHAECRMIPFIGKAGLWKFNWYSSVAICEKCENLVREGIKELVKKISQCNSTPEKGNIGTFPKSAIDTQGQKHVPDYSKRRLKVVAAIDWENPDIDPAAAIRQLQNMMQYLLDKDVNKL